MNEFTIHANNFLNQNIQGYYNTLYTGMHNPGNPDYINDLKNTYNNFTQTILRSATIKLTETLRTDLPQIYNLLNLPELTICLVPRAKAHNSYYANQLLFESTVKEVVNELNLIDGTDYIRRQVNTRTTHLPDNIPNYNNDGRLPYIGITTETCNLSPNIQGSNILLVDDLYTPGKNIDEDALQALLNNNPNSVTFYSIGKI